LSKSASYPPAERLAWAVRFCENAQIRLTPARVKILACLARHRSPVNLETISLAEGIRGCWDATTVYRTLMLLKGLEVVRQVSVRHKVRYFVLNVPGEVCDYLICRCCGSIAELPLLQTVVDLEQKVRRTQGYTAVYHELEIYGICPQCQSAGKWSWPSSKLPVRT
jgi:Fur family ferric uptake transcriptional regulator